MAGNDWINSYLEAILDVGPGIDEAKSSLLLRERGHFSPTRYFVEEVITGFDETDLHRSWVKAAATRSPQERNTRLENMCWRIWNLARQKKQLEGEEAQRKAKRRLERERGRREAVADMSEDLSEGEKGDTVSDMTTQGDSTRGRLPRISSVDMMDTWASNQKSKKLYIVLISSGSDVYYPSLNSEDGPFMVDEDYHSQIEYRWGGEGVRKTLVRWAASITDKKSENQDQVIHEDEKLSSNYCYAFEVQKPEVVPPVKDVRKVLRIQALRCLAVYCRSGTRLNIIPVLASRSQALRYLYIRWGVDLSKMVVFVGESGDTDYEGLLGGIHKTIIMKGIAPNTGNRLYANRSYPLSDVVPFDSPNIIQTSENCNSSILKAALDKLGTLKS